MTRLKALELFGFKSFADRTRFEFPEGLTVVVGPNGSGKSNVVDAIKWVLGEQSMRSLRGRDATDVSFAGSVSRKPLNAAETSLIFDNSARALPVEQDEVQITRRVYRSGESEDLVNGEISRLRDLRELFSGTGAATEAYSVIEQGRVDALLVAFGLANVLAVVPIMPGGLGVIDVALSSALIGFGAPADAALLVCGMGPMGDPMAGNGKMTWQRWDWRKGEKLDQIRDGQHGSGLMETLAWSPDGAHFVMAGRQAQGTWNLAIFSAADGSLVTSIDTKQRITQARFTADGQRLVLAGAQSQSGPKDGQWPAWGRVQVYSVDS